MEAENEKEEDGDEGSIHIMHSHSMDVADKIVDDHTVRRELNRTDGNDLCEGNNDLLSTLPPIDRYYGLSCDDTLSDLIHIMGIRSLVHLIVLILMDR